MEIIDLFNRLRGKNIDLSLSGSDLEVGFDGDFLPDDIIAEIKNRKAEIIDFLKGIKYGKDAAIPVIPEQYSYPLSPGQRRLWILSQFEEGNIAYNMPAVYLFEGNLDRAALQYCFIELITRHESLRTVFKQDEQGEIRQHICSPEKIKFNIGYEDLQQESEQLKYVKKLVSDSSGRPFDLASGPLLRAALYQLEAHKWMFVYTMHHIVSDGWSMDVLIRELLLLYNAHISGIGNPLPLLRIQYKDYAAWQLEQLNGESLRRHKEYWLKQFEGELPVLDLPGDNIRPALRGYRGGIQYKLINKELAQGIKDLSLEQNGTLFMSLLAAINILLHKYTGQKDIIIGTPIAGRDHIDLEGQIGFYLNILALRTRFSSGHNFKELLENVKGITLGAYEHQVYPFDELVDDLQLKRDASRNALFDVMVTLQSTAGHKKREEQLNDLKVSIYQGEEHRVSKFDLTFAFNDTEEGIQVSLEYNSDIYNEDTISRLGDHLLQLLNVIVAEPAKPISQLDYLHEEERWKLLIEFNNTEADYPKESTIVDLFEEQVSRTPDRIAVVFEDKELTYRELSARSNQLGGYLRKTHKIQADDLIGIQLVRSEWLIVSILGTLKSGGAYVPIDPEYPMERINYILGDSKCKVVVNEDLLKEITWTADDHKTDSKREQFSSNNLAYCIYTSGSTGKPKGCLLSHRNVVNFFTGMNHVFGKDPGTILSATNYTFDISVLELVWTLTLGYKVVIQKDTRDVLPVSEKTRKPLDFSLFYFGNAEIDNDTNKYRLLLEGAKYADKNGYAAVWTPERHFHEFGGLYPNPSIIGAALAMSTKNISIRAGSVVLPLHNPLRIAEEWSVIDNLSDGRTGIACASGWHSGDFVLSPENYRKRHEVMYQMIDTIKKLWSGAAVSFVDGNGALKETQIFPKPVQKEIPLWITSANNIETFISAGRLGLNVLTHLLGETIEGLAAKISAYRKAYIEGGYAIEKAQVALMLHTYIGEDTDEIHDKVHDPFINYLRTSVGLLKNLAVSLNIDINAESFSKEDMDVLLEHSFKRYVSSASLIGTKSTCVKMLDRLGEIGVTEIACLIDFGVEYNAVMKSLEYLTEIKTAYRSRATDTDLPDYSVHAQLKRHGVTHLQLTPSMAMLLKPALHSATSLRKLIIGGERLPLSLARDLYSGLSDVEIYNMYGPTETTIWSSCYKVGRKDGKILIGRPIANTKIYILDRAEKPVPVGMEGEIYIGGEGVARSYLNNPKLTMERFILNPFSAGERLYRTGDYGKWLVDGNIEYIGRKDDQVKIQGHRIELGEIEAALLHNQTIESCAVTSRDGAYGEKELVAYIVSRQALKIADIRSALDAKLPRYMLPSHYIQLDELPLNHSGKTDKKRLPELQGRGMETGVEYIAPRNDTEERLALIWQEILGKEKIGIKDNFFELGGNSIKITRLASLLNRRFEVKLGFQELFTNTVLEDQARSIRQSGKTSFTTISPAPVQPHYPLTSSQHRLWVLSQFEETSIAYNMSGVYIFEGDLNLPSLEYSFNSLIVRHESLRTVFREDEDGEIRQFVCSPEAVGFSMIRQDLRTTPRQDEQLKVLLEQELIKPFNLESGPLLRVNLFRLSDNKWIIIYVMHHIISDGWSLNVLIKELLLLYNSHNKGDANPLQPLRIQYKDYAVWQQAQLNDEILREHKSYWLKQFEGTLPVLNLTGNKDRPAIKTYNGAITDKIITADLSRRFKFFCKQQGGTLFQGLLAAVNALLYKYTDQKDIIIGSPTAGRELTDLENQIGLYVNTLAFRTRFKGEDSFYELFEVVKQTALDAYEHQTYPFDALVSSLNIQRDVSRNVLFDVWMVLHNTEVSYNAEEQNTEKLKIGRYPEAGKVISKFDLLFHFREMGDELGVSIEYNTDILSKRKADELGEQFEAILTYVTKHPEMLLCKMTNRLTEMEEETKNEHLRKIRVKNLVKLKNKGI